VWGFDGGQVVGREWVRGGLLCFNIGLLILLWQFLAIFLISYWFQLAYPKVERCFVEGRVSDCLVSYLRHRCLISSCLFNDGRPNLFLRRSKEA